MQKIITLPHCRICVVDQEWMNGCEAEYYHIGTDNLVYGNYGQIDHPLNFNPLPLGQWQLLGVWPEITEEQAGKVVQQSIHTGLFAHYVLGIPVNTYYYKSSLESFQSLLTSHNLPTDKRMAVLWELNLGAV